MKRVISTFGRYVIEVISYIGLLFLFSSQVIKGFFRKPLYLGEVINHLENIAYRSLPIVVSISFFSGLILSLNIGKSMDEIVKGTSQYIGAAIMLAMLKELGPVLTSIALISRFGAGTTSQIASMKATEQIDALEVMSVSSIDFLVIPRVLAMILMMPVMVFISVVSGVLGGFIMAISQLDVSTSAYIQKSIMVLNAGDIFEVIIKSCILGFVIGVVSCYYGINSKGGAEGVGMYVTKSVVMSVVFVIITDFVVTSLFLSFRRII